jgi:hypothetical protein
LASVTDDVDPLVLAQLGYCPLGHGRLEHDYPPHHCAVCDADWDVFWNGDVYRGGPALRCHKRQRVEHLSQVVSVTRIWPASLLRLFTGGWGMLIEQGLHLMTQELAEAVASLTV